MIVPRPVLVKARFQLLAVRPLHDRRKLDVVVRHAQLLLWLEGDVAFVVVNDVIASVVCGRRRAALLAKGIYLPGQLDFKRILKRLEDVHLNPVNKVAIE